MKKIILCGLILCYFFTLEAWAEETKKEEGIYKYKFPCMDCVFNKVLTQEQKIAVKKIMYRYEAALQMRQKNPSDPKIQSSIQKYSKQIYDLLTDEQMKIYTAQHGKIKEAVDYNEKHFNLSAEQKQAILSIRKKYKTELEEVRKGNLNKTEKRKLQDKIYKEIADTLTEEQKTIFYKRINEERTIALKKTSPQTTRKYKNKADEVKNTY